MSERFFVDSPIRGPQGVLIGDEARHLAAVMRAKIGDEVILFDGSGAEFVARVTALRKQAVELAIDQRREISRELSISLTLAVALPKGDRQKWLIEKATELGVTCLVPLITERGVAEPTVSALDRLRRAVVEASKQCGRNRLMQIATPASAAHFFTSAPASGLRLIADPSGQPLAATHSASHSTIHAAIGPEGGFSTAERTGATSSGWQMISLGPRILRVETAAVALAAWSAIKTIQ